MVGRGELTEEAWSVIAPLLPGSGQRGGQWRDHRTVINGSLWKLRTGAPWRDLPERYGPWQTCADRLYRWRRDGTWDRILAHLQTTSDAVGEIVWEVSLDSTAARAHQHASGARRRPSQADAKRGSGIRPTRGLAAAVAGRPPRSIWPATAKGGRSPWSSRPDTGMIVPNWGRCWTASGCAALVGEDGRGPGRIVSSPTRATATRAVVGCSGRDTSRTSSRSAAISGHDASPGQVGHCSSTRQPTRGATSSSAASTGSNSGAGWPRATRSER
jgi:transposase